MHGESDKRNRPSVTSLIAFAIIVVGGYVLSPGLIVPLEKAGYLDNEGALTRFVEVFYWPLGWCYDNIGVGGVILRGIL